jgi:hypothetical protein
MSEEHPESEEEPWLSREEIVTRDVERQIAENEEIQRWIEARCRLAVEQWRATHPWADDPGMCVSVPIRRVFLP